ncbi:MAG: InlB B-repeat-containing protein, partial [Bacilli bacterium]|nr:InlB B-repeat-containing protein [Bacilli bacterium]
DPVEDYLFLYAGWRSDEATITYDFNYDGAPEAVSETVEVFTALTAPEVPERDGYRFTAWCSDRQGREPFDLSGGIWHDTILYAGWAESTGRIIYNFNYSGAPDNYVQIIELGEKATPIDDPERENYAFTGWYLDMEATRPFGFEEEINDSLLILYAGWNLVTAVITFDPNYEGAETYLGYADVGSPIEEIDDPERTGYDFAYWSYDEAGEEAFDPASLIEEDLILYANWTKKSYQVRYLLNYEGHLEDVYHSTTVLYQDSAELPSESPIRDGYLFAGWYLEKEAINQYAGNRPILGPTDYYAGWIEEAEEDATIQFVSGDDPTIVYDSSSVALGGQIQAIDAPDVDESVALFSGWYLDRAYQNPFVSGQIATGDLTIYAKWLKRYTFEAEYTDLTDKPAQGTSSNGSGPEGIVKSQAGMENEAIIGASNGYYVADLYYYGAEIKFEIHSDVAVTDARLVLRATPQYYTMILTPSLVNIAVNGVALNYPMHVLFLDGYAWPTDGGTRGSPEMNVRPFENYLIADGISLKEGDNVITLTTVNHNDHDATYNAETPSYDCIYIYSESTLSWSEGKCFLDNI